MTIINLTDGIKELAMCADEDGGLSLETLKSGYPEATNILYPSVDSQKILLRIANGKVYNTFGWDPSLTYTIYSMDRPLITPIDLQKSKKYEKYLFCTKVLLKDSDGSIIEDKDMKYSCVPFQTSLIPKRFFVISTRHGSHQCLEVDDRIKIYNSEHLAFDVKVVMYDDDCDFIIFESKVRLCDRMPRPGSVIGGSRYAMLGFADLRQREKDDEQIRVCYAGGVIISDQPNSIGHVCGSFGGVAGISGGPVFDLDNNSLIGICLSMDEETTTVRIMPVAMASDLLFSTIKTKKQLKRSSEDDDGQRK